jgi:acetate kinase
MSSRVRMLKVENKRLPDALSVVVSSSPGCRSIGRELGSLAGAMGGIDGLVLTAGICENSAEMRERICERARWLGVRLDETANRTGGPRLSSADSRVSAWVIPTNEECIIAGHTLAVWRKRQGHG